MGNKISVSHKKSEAKQHTMVGKFGKASFFAFIKRKREEAKALEIESLQAHNLIGDLLRKLYDDYKTIEDINWYHLMIATEHEEHFLTLWKKYEGSAITDISCDCTTVGGRPHRHLIVMFPVGKKTNTFNKAFNSKFSKKINPWKTSAEVAKERGPRKYYLKPINTAVHLLHTVLYISTKHTKGFHSGKLEECEHYNHTFLAFENKKKMNKWRKDVFLVAHPDIGHDMQVEWEKLEALRAMKEAIGDDKVTKTKFGLYKGKQIKRVD